MHSSAFEQGLTEASRCAGFSVFRIDPPPGFQAQQLPSQQSPTHRIYLGCSTTRRNIPRVTGQWVKITNKSKELKEAAQIVYKQMSWTEKKKTPCWKHRQKSCNVPQELKHRGLGYLLDFMLEMSWIRLVHACTMPCVSTVGWWWNGRAHNQNHGKNTVTVECWRKSDQYFQPNLPGRDV